MLAKHHATDNIAIAFPDDGAQKRFGRYFEDRPDWEHIICAKVRQGDKRIVTIKEGNPAGKHCFIVDDLVKTGGTLITCKDVLLAGGATHVRCALCGEGWEVKRGEWAAEWSRGSL